MVRPESRRARQMHSRSFYPDVVGFKMGARWGSHRVAGHKAPLSTAVPFDQRRCFSGSPIAPSFCSHSLAF
jgi:hypothetical protein